MKMKSKITTATATAISTFYCYFCSRHILITFVGMTLLIVNYGVNTVQMSAVPYKNGNCNNGNCSSGSGNGRGNNVVPHINGNKLDNKSNISRNIVRKRSVENNTNLNTNRNTNFLHIAQPAMPTVYKDNKNVADDDSNDNYAANTNNYNMHNLRLNSNNNTINHNKTDLAAGQFGKFRKSRIFGLLGSNFSLSYNLSLNTGTSAGNISIVSAAPTYYYAPAPTYPYGYYGYYDPYAYNPYAYNPYAGYGYYG